MNAIKMTRDQNVWGNPRGNASSLKLLRNPSDYLSGTQTAEVWDCDESPLIV